jgi:uncharacterized protein (UPF0332 family)
VDTRSQPFRIIGPKTPKIDAVEKSPDGRSSARISPHYAYYAMFQGTQVALDAAGFVRLEWRRAGLHATFANELTRRRKLCSSTFASDLAILMGLRHTADYRVHDLGKRRALRALNKASRFVNAVKKRIFHG